MDYKLICIDLDGTLTTKNFTISKENKKALLYALNKGIKVFFVSGRSYNVMEHLKKEISNEIFCIGSNGTYFNIQGIEYKKTLDKESIKKIYNICKKNNINMHFKGCKNIIATNNLSDESYYKKLAQNHKNVINLIENATLTDVLEHRFDILKCIAFSDDLDSLLKIKECLKQNENLCVVSSSIKNFEVMAKNTSKAIAIKNVCKILNIDKSQIICIGDSENDISMIKYAGVGIAMGNALKEVKEICNFITDTNINDGVAKAIYKYI